MMDEQEGLIGYLHAYEIGAMNPIKLEIPENNAVLID